MGRYTLRGPISGRRTPDEFKYLKLALGRGLRCRALARGRIQGRQHLFDEPREHLCWCADCADEAEILPVADMDEGPRRGLHC